MNALKALNKEQLTAAATVVLCAIFLAGGLLGGGVAPAQVPTALADRPYEKPPLRSPEFVDAKFDRYWQGRDIFAGQTTSKLAVPSLKAPEPREEDLAAPLFRPGPALEVFNRLPLKAKYLPLAAGAPVVPEGDLPPAAELEALRKIEEPVMSPRPDRRAERRREHFVLYPKGGEPREGRLVNDGPAEIKFVNRKTNQLETWPRDKVLKVEYNHTFEEEYTLSTRRIKPGPQEAAERLKLAQQLVEQGMIKEAKEELRKAADVRKDHVEAYVVLARLHFDESDFEGAVSVLEAGIGAVSQTSVAELYYELGRCHRALHFLDGAIHAFEKAVHESPRHQRSKLALARTLLEAGRHKAAYEMAHDFFVKRASDVDVTAEQRAEGYVLRGMAQLRGGDLEKARADLGEALKLNPQHGEATNALGVLDAVDGKFREAGARFAAAVRANQYLTDAWTNLGALLLLGGKAADAEAIYAAAQQRDPVSAEPVAGIGLAQVLAGKKEGLAVLERAAQLDPGHAASRAVAGALKLRENADDAALGLFVEALRADASYLPSYYGAAMAYLRSATREAALAGAERDEAKAAELYRKAQELRVNAETLLKSVRDFDPARPNPWIALGCAYARMNRPEEARAALNTALQLLVEQKKPVDPLLQYARGFVEYWYGPGETEEQRLDYAATLFAQGEQLQAEAKDPVSTRAVADCKLASELIQSWKLTSIRVDDRFEREASAVVGANWVESEEYNVAASIEPSAEHGGRLKFSGKQGKADMGLTYIERLIPSENFHTFELTFIPQAVKRTEYGFSIYYQQQGATKIGFHVGVDMQGKVRFNAHASYPNDMDRKGMEIGWTEVKTPLPNPKEVTIRVTRGQRGNVPQFNIWFYDPAKADWILAHKEINATGAGSASRGVPWHIAIWARAWRDEEYTIYVDNVRVYERARR